MSFPEHSELYFTMSWERQSSVFCKHDSKKSPNSLSSEHPLYYNYFIPVIDRTFTAVMFCYLFFFANYSSRKQSGTYKVITGTTEDLFADLAKCFLVLYS